MSNPLASRVLTGIPPVQTVGTFRNWLITVSKDHSKGSKSENSSPIRWRTTRHVKTFTCGSRRDHIIITLSSVWWLLNPGKKLNATAQERTHVESIIRAFIRVLALCTTYRISMKKTRNGNGGVRRNTLQFAFTITNLLADLLADNAPMYCTPTFTSTPTHHRPP